MSIWAEIKKALNSDFLNEPLNVKTDRIEVDTQDIQSTVNAITGNKQIKSISSISVTQEVYTTLLNVTSGKGTLSFIRSAWLNSSSSVKTIALKVTIDGIIEFWGGYTNTTVSDVEVSMNMFKPNRLSAYNTIMYSDSRVKEINIGMPSNREPIVPYSVNGDFLETQAIRVGCYPLEKDYVFNENCKVEVLVFATSSDSNVVNTVIDYSLE